MTGATRISLLLAAATTADARLREDWWRRWRALVPDLDAVTGAETALLPAVWSHLAAEGATDPAAGRWRGVQRRAAVQAMATLAAAGQTQQRLLAAGIPSALTGAAAAALAHPAGGRWPTPRADLAVAAGHAAAAAGRPLTHRERLLGRVPADDVVTVRWRQVGRGAPDQARPVDWQGRTLLVLAPHDVAYAVLLRTVVSRPPGHPDTALPLLDLVLLSRHPGFDRARFSRAVRESRWRGALRAHGTAWRDAVPAPVRDLLTGDRQHAGAIATGWGSAQSQAAPRLTRLAGRVLR